MRAGGADGQGRGDWRGPAHSARIDRDGESGRQPSRTSWHHHACHARVRAHRRDGVGEVFEAGGAKVLVDSRVGRRVAGGGLDYAGMGASVVGAGGVGHGVGDDGLGHGFGCGLAVVVVLGDKGEVLHSLRGGAPGCGGHEGRGVCAFHLSRLEKASLRHVG